MECSVLDVLFWTLQKGAAGFSAADGVKMTIEDASNSDSRKRNIPAHVQPGQEYLFDNALRFKRYGMNIAKPTLSVVLSLALTASMVPMAHAIADPGNSSVGGSTSEPFSILRNHKC
jgi:hypothetical protein